MGREESWRSGRCPISSSLLYIFVSALRMVKGVKDGNTWVWGRFLGRLGTGLPFLQDDKEI
jgi:hypothetical protein